MLGTLCGLWIKCCGLVYEHDLILFFCTQEWNVGMEAIYVQCPDHSSTQKERDKETYWCHKSVHALSYDVGQLHMQACIMPIID
jgi:hypothetical protein